MLCWAIQIVQELAQGWNFAINLYFVLWPLIHLTCYCRKLYQEGTRLSPEEFESNIQDLNLTDEPITKYYKLGQVLGLDRGSIVRSATLIQYVNLILLV